MHRRYRQIARLIYHYCCVRYMKRVDGRWVEDDNLRMCHGSTVSRNSGNISRFISRIESENTQGDGIMDETEKVKEILTQELKRWNNAQLHDAFEYCDKMSKDTGNVWWMELTETVRREITDRGGRR